MRLQTIGSPWAAMQKIQSCTHCSITCFALQPCSWHASCQQLTSWSSCHACETSVQQSWRLPPVWPTVPVPGCWHLHLSSLPLSRGQATAGTTTRPLQGAKPPLELHKSPWLVLFMIQLYRVLTKKAPTSLSTSPRLFLMGLCLCIRFCCIRL